MAIEAPQLPHFEVFHRVLELPMIEMALTKSVETYTKLKGSHWLVHWALTTAESSFESATRHAVPIATPLAKKLENPIHFVDHTLCLGLDKIEERVPLVKEKPEQILANAYGLAVKKVQPAVSTIYHVNDALIEQATNLRDLSWNKANQILETHYGTAAVKRLDNTAIVMDNLIDAYFPAIEEEDHTDSTMKTEEEDKLLHSLQTVGRLSNKAARRVYINIIHRTKTLNKDNLRRYIAFLLEFLQLTQYINAINEKVVELTSPRKDGAALYFVTLPSHRRTFHQVNNVFISSSLIGISSSSLTNEKILYRR
ncbi:lipid storage droplets surface-binding protein 2-like isoform X1 [Vespa mandarinia]|uniref:lipid storage droplets surface-binding protein 2-like isoform X1 n=1 Tax=Vespa mandarinia TaxID=7446 RepID=UPI00160B08A2|nr:lipid storage droplets surface-binding protein 2-like isoform X1 [Vespa mandarinia]